MHNEHKNSDSHEEEISSMVMDLFSILSIAGVVVMAVLATTMDFVPEIIYGEMTINGKLTSIAVSGKTEKTEFSGYVDSDNKYESEIDTNIDDRDMRLIEMNEIKKDTTLIINLNDSNRIDLRIEKSAILVSSDYDIIGDKTNRIKIEKWNIIKNKEKANEQFKSLIRDYEKNIIEEEKKYVIVIRIMLKRIGENKWGINSTVRMYGFYRGIRIVRNFILANEKRIELTKALLSEVNVRNNVIKTLKTNNIRNYPVKNLHGYWKDKGKYYYTEKIKDVDVGYVKELFNIKKTHQLNNDSLKTVCVSANITRGMYIGDTIEFYGKYNNKLFETKINFGTLRAALILENAILKKIGKNDED